MLDVTPDVEAVYSRACAAPLLPEAERVRGPALDRQRVAALLPHRDPFLLVDRIMRVDRGAGLIVSRYDLARAAAIFNGHFPGHPVWPGVLQVEAIGQTGLCLLGLRAERVPRSGTSVAMTQVLAAQFLRPVRAGGELEIVAQVLADGLFTVIVGQCLQAGSVCSAAAVRGIDKEEDG